MDVSDIFYFFCSGEGKAESEAPGRGGLVFIQNPKGGVSCRRGGGGPRGWEGVCGEGGGRGLHIFLRGRNSHQGNLEEQLSGVIRANRFARFARIG